MDDLLAHIKTQISLDSFAGSTLTKMWSYVEQYYANSQNQNTKSFLSSQYIKNSQKSLIKSINNDNKPILNSNLKNLLWPIIINIPDLYFQKNDTILHDNRSTIEGGSKIKNLQSTYSFEDTEENIILVKASQTSIFKEFFGNPKGEMTVLNSNAAFVILQIIARFRETGVLQSEISSQTKIDPRSTFHYIRILETKNLVRKFQYFKNGLNTNKIFLNLRKDIEFQSLKNILTESNGQLLKTTSFSRNPDLSIHEKANNLKSKILEASTQNEINSAKIQIPILKSFARNLILESLQRVKGNILVADDISGLVGLNFREIKDRKFINRLLTTMEEEGTIEVVRANVIINPTNIKESRKKKATNSSIKRCIRLTPKYISTISNNPPGNNENTLNSLIDNQNFDETQASIIHSDLELPIDPEVQYMAIALGNFNSGLLASIPPEIQVIFLATISGKKGLTMKTSLFFLKGLSYKFIHRVFIKLSRKVNQKNPTLIAVNENIGRISYIRYFINPKVEDFILKSLPPAFVNPKINIIKVIENRQTLEEQMNLSANSSLNQQINQTSNLGNDKTSNPRMDIHDLNQQALTLFDNPLGSSSIDPGKISHSDETDLSSSDQFEDPLENYKGTKNKKEIRGVSQKQYHLKTSKDTIALNVSGIDTENNEPKKLQNPHQTHKETISPTLKDIQDINNQNSTHLDQDSNSENKIRWTVFSSDYINRCKKLNFRISLSKLIREQIVLDLLEKYKIIELSEILTTNVQSFITEYHTLVENNKVDLTYSESSTSKVYSNRTKTTNGKQGIYSIPSKLVDLNLLVSSNTSKNNSNYKLDKKTLFRTFNDLESLGYGNTRVIYWAHEGLNYRFSISKDQIEENKDDSLLNVKGRSGQKTYFIHKSIDPDSETVRNFIENNYEKFTSLKTPIKFLKNRPMAGEGPIEVERPKNARPESNHERQGIKNLQKSIKTPGGYENSPLKNKGYVPGNSPLNKKLKRKNSSKDTGSTNTDNSSLPFKRSKLLDPNHGYSSDIREYSSSTESDIAQNEITIQLNIQAIITNMFLNPMATKAKVFHEFLVDSIYTKKAENNHMFSYGRFLSSALLEVIPLNLLFKFVRFRNFGSNLLDFLSGKFDKDIIQVLPQERLIGYPTDDDNLDSSGGKNSFNSASKLLISDRLSISLCHLPRPVLQDVLQEIGNIRLFLQFLFSLLVRLELLRPIKLRSLVDIEPIPENLRERVFGKSEQKKVLAQSGLMNVNVNFTGSSDLDQELESNNIINEDMREKNTSEPGNTSDVDIIDKLTFELDTDNTENPQVKRLRMWTDFKKLCPGYQLMTKARIRNYNENSILPSYASENYYDLRIRSGFVSYWDNLKSVCLKNIKKENNQHSSSAENKSRNLLEPDNDNCLSKNTTSDVKNIPYVKERSDPLSYINSPYSWENANRITMIQKSILENNMDASKMYTPIKNEKLCYYIALQSQLDISQVNYFYKKYETMWATSQKKRGLDMLEASKISNVANKRRKMANVYMDYIENLDTNDNNNLSTFISEKKEVLEKYISLLRNIDSEIYTKMDGRFVFSSKGDYSNGSNLGMNLRSSTSLVVNSKNVLPGNLKPLPNFRFETLKEYPKNIILQYALSAKNMLSIQDYMEIFRYLKKADIDGFLKEAKKIEQSSEKDKNCGSANLNQQNEISSIDTPSKSKSLYTTIDQNESNCALCKANNQSSNFQNGSFSECVGCKINSLSANSYEFLGELISYLYADNMLKNLKDEAKEKNTRDRKKIHIVDYNRLMVSVVVLNYLHKEYQFPLFWKLIDLSFLRHYKGFSASRTRNSFSKMMKNSNNVDYFNKLESIYSIVRPLAAKLGHLSDLDFLINGKNTNTNHSVLESNDSTNRVGNINSLGFEKGNISLESQKNYYTDLDGNTKNAPNKVNLQAETDYIVGLVFYWGVPYLMDLFGLSNNTSFNHSLKPSLMTGRRASELKNNETAPIVYKLPKNLKLLLSSYQLSESVYRGIPNYGFSNISNTQGKGERKSFKSFEQFDQPSDSDSESENHRFKYMLNQKQPKNLEESLTVKKNIKQAVIAYTGIVHSLRMSRISLLNQNSIPAVLSKHLFDPNLVCYLEKAAGGNQTENKIDVKIFRLISAWVELGGFVVFSSNEDFVQCPFTNNSTDIPDTPESLLPTINNKESDLFHELRFDQIKSVYLGTVAISKSLDKTNRLYGYYPLVFNVDENVLKNTDSETNHINHSLAFKDFTESDETNTNTRLTVPSGLMIDSGIELENDLGITSNENQISKNDLEKLKGKTVTTIIPEVDNYIKCILIQYVIFELLFTPDSIYNSEKFYSLMMDIFGRLFSFLEEPIHSNIGKRQYMNLQLGNTNNEVVQESAAISSAMSTRNINYKYKTIIRNKLDVNLFHNNVLQILEMLNRIGLISKIRGAEWSNLKHYRFKSPDNKNLTYNSKNLLGSDTDKIESSSTSDVSGHKTHFNENIDMDVNMLESHDISKAKSLSAGSFRNNLVKSTIKGFTFSEKFQIYTSSRFASEHFLTQIVYAKLCLSNYNSSTSSLNPNFSQSDESITSLEDGESQLISSRTTNKVINCSESFVKGKGFPIRKMISSGETAFYVELLANRKADWNIEYFEKTLPFHSFAALWKEGFVLQSKDIINSTYPEPTCVSSDPIVDDYLKRSSKKAEKICSTFKISENCFFYSILARIISDVVFCSGPMGATLMDIKLAIIARQHPPLRLPSDHEIRFLVSFLDSNKLMGTIPAAHTYTRGHHSICLDFISKHLNFSDYKSIFLYGYEELRYISSDFSSVWSLKGFVSDNRLSEISSFNRKQVSEDYSSDSFPEDSISEKISENTDIIDAQIESDEHTYPEKPLSVSYKEKGKQKKTPIENLKLDGNLDNKGTNSEHLTKIWFDLDGKVSKRFKKKLIESAVSLIFNSPGIYESTILRKFNKALSNAELLELLEYMISSNLIYKKSVTPLKQYLDLSAVQNSIHSSKSKTQPLFNISMNSLFKNKNYNIKGPKVMLSKPGSVLFDNNTEFQIVNNDSISHNIITCYWVAPNHLDMLAEI
ncbi:hypothetical protein BB558_003400 [Smittium angustum]|uniref:B-block binding subunit of TFIIIC domain-containing protein n=1 Tax=Smittium angustum TaxID=133377 RepID=A0A2U1J639_SMIAN|nr:hypothetical protein BB558_003400 [Smittium angustum]